MGNGQGHRKWLIHLIVFAGYALAYIIVDPNSDAHWNVSRALGLSCLLLLPYRFWPALLLGEALSNTILVLRCLDSFGAAWVAIRCIPPTLVMTPIVWWCRQRLRLFPTKRLVDIKALMLCVLLVSLVTTLHSIISLLFVTMPAFHVEPVMALGYFVGNYIAILGVVPIVLMTVFDLRGQRRGIRAQLREYVASPLTFDLTCIAAPLMAALAFASTHGDIDTQHIARMAMFLPVAWLTLKHGWRAAVAGGVLAIIATCLLTASRPDPQIIETQAFISLAITCLMATGARISAQLVREAKQKQADVNLVAMARRTLEAHEQRRKHLSSTLETIALRLHVANHRLRRNLRDGLIPSSAVLDAKQTLDAPDLVLQLAESLHPSVWRERGLPAALTQTIGRVLDEAGVAYGCALTGRGYIHMAPETLNAAYRSACEAVVCVTSKLSCSRVQMTLRAGQTSGRYWLVITVDGHHHHALAAAAGVRKRDREQIALRLGASPYSIDQLCEMARLFGGRLHHRTGADRERIRILIQDTATAIEGERHKDEPLRLWVS